MPRTFAHWTPRYIANRIALAYHQRAAPRDPWLTKTACAYLANWLRESDIGIEWGCGRSTIWFAERVGRLTSIEHNPQWSTRVKLQLAERRLANVDLRLASIGNSCGAGGEAYVNVGNEFSDNSVDFALVDGQLRHRCAAVAVRILKPGGLLIVDNAELYVAHRSHSPGSISRSGRSAADGWQSLARELRGWRSVWTTNGVWDTAIYCKPAEPRPVTS